MRHDTPMSRSIWDPFRMNVQPGSAHDVDVDNYIDFELSNNIHA